MNQIIAIDGDGVLLDNHQAYRQAWHKAFGVLPKLKDPLAYWPMDRWDVHQLDGADHDRFRKCFDYQFWSNVPAVPGAVDAALKLHEVGYELVCVTALDSQFESARLKNLQNLGFPIERVVATNNDRDQVSPKAAVLYSLKPVAFVDDYLPYLFGITAGIHKALILREPNGSPNIGPLLAAAHSQHDDLTDFVSWWIGQNEK
ncbi:HAD family hydrolase [Undibacterium sp. RTI2.1]|uniref:HAD family hydrolase n=1 Tax=unclassified Undibacterium TaxID=2630295 RepID=UPI002B23D8EA|nr:MULTISPECIES: HAD family hydrolase [unclassified Undibacterium]MEB0033160.1 HAD family hydrolase [Undibacterium sp. RTI2.1]MEB0118960.1 HAD family hydrolase [Undibacterium sp. RTI2.2]